MRNLWRVRPQVTRCLPQLPLAPGRRLLCKYSILGRFDPRKSDRFHRGIQGNPKVFPVHEAPKTLKMAEESQSALFVKQNIHASMPVRKQWFLRRPDKPEGCVIIRAETSSRGPHRRNSHHRCRYQ